MLVPPGSHRYRVIAMNRYGLRSSPGRAFTARAGSNSCHFPYTRCHFDLSRHLTKVGGDYVKRHGGTVAGAAALVGAVCTKVMR